MKEFAYLTLLAGIERSHLDCENIRMEIIFESLWTALSELFQSIDHHSWILDLILHPFLSVLFKTGL